MYKSTNAHPDKPKRNAAQYKLIALPPNKTILRTAHPYRLCHNSLDYGCMGFTHTARSGCCRFSLADISNGVPGMVGVGVAGYGVACNVI